MARSKIECFVLASYPHKNSSNIVKILCEEGVKTIFGRGYKELKSKRLIFDNRFINLEIDGEIKEDLISVSDVKINSYNKEIVTNYKINQVLNIIAELIINIEQINNSFNLFYYTINKINKDNYKLFILFWLSYSYISINDNKNLSSCISCSTRDNIVSFNFILGGYICKKCQDREKSLSLEQLKTINTLHKMNYDKIEKNDEELIKIYTDYLVNAQGLYLKQLEKYVRNL